MIILNSTFKNKVFFDAEKNTVPPVADSIHPDTKKVSGFIINKIQPVITDIMSIKKTIFSYDRVVGKIVSEEDVKYANNLITDRFSDLETALESLSPKEIALISRFIGRINSESESKMKSFREIVVTDTESTFNLGSETVADRVLGTTTRKSALQKQAEVETALQEQCIDFIARTLGISSNVLRQTEIYDTLRQLYNLQSEYSKIVDDFPKLKSLF